jgi:membrane protein YdbS with pleckstrin-like domain
LAAGFKKNYMDFQNELVAMQSLPRAEEAELNPIHPDYLKIMRIDWFIAAAVLTTVLFFLIYWIPFMQSAPWIYLAPALVILFLILLYFFQQLSFKSKAYALRAKDIIYRNGVIIQSTAICPFNRIQNSSISQGPLERKYKLAALHLYTAGSAGADMVIKGLKLDEARQIKEWLSKKTADEPTIES